MIAISLATEDVAADADTTEHSQNRPLPRFCFRDFAAQFPDPPFKVVSRT